MELWRDVFQAGGFSLEKVQTAFYAKLDEQVERHRELIAALPRLRGAVRVEDNRVEVQAIGSPPDDWSTVCRFRSDEDSSDRDYLTGIPAGDNRFLAFRNYFPASNCWYQLGLTDGQDRVIYEPWQRVPLRP